MAILIYSCTLADSVNLWLQLDFILGHAGDWFRRSKMICDEPSMLAYTLYPVCRGSQLNEAQILKVKATIYKHGDDIYSELEKFLSSSEYFGDTDIKALSPLSYWKMMKLNYPLISKIALAYVTLPSSTASLERVFSMWAYVHNKTRNSLSELLSEKLIFLHHSNRNIGNEALMFY